MGGMAAAEKLHCCFDLILSNNSINYPISNSPPIKIFTMMREEDEQRRALYELCSMTIHILRSPPLPISFPAALSLFSSPQISPAAFGSLFIGISVALMLFGSVTFVIGLVLMPLVITLVTLFYFVGIVSNLSDIGRSILCPNSDSNIFVPVWNYSSSDIIN